MRVDLLRCSDLFDARVVHDDHAIGYFERLFLVVRDEDAGHVDFVVQAANPLAKLLAHLRIERAERLVKQQHAGLRRERPRQRDTLPLAARQLRGIAVLQRFEADQMQHLVDALANQLARRFAHLESIRDVLRDGHVPEQRVVLEDETNFAIARRLLGDVLAVADDGPGVGDFESRDDAQQRRLAGSRRSEQREQLAVRNVEADALERRKAAELLRNTIDGDAHERSSFVPSAADLTRAASALSTPTLASSVSSATSVSSDATANEPGKLYS